MCESNSRLHRKVAIVTGGGSGVGYEVAKNLARLGAKVILASRNETKLKRAADEIRKNTGNENVMYRKLDLGSLKSVRSFAYDTMINENRLDILVNNAGAVALPDVLTEDGINLTMQVNYFGVFLLTYLLLPMLKISAPSRIITGSAASMYIGEIDFEHWNEIGRYNLVASLSNSKLADALLSAELDRKLKGTGVTSNSYDPFLVAGTDLLGNLPSFIKNIGSLVVDSIGQSKETVGKQVTYLAAADEMEAISGMHYKFCQLWFNHWMATDHEFTSRMWNESKKIVKISPEEDWERNI